MEWSDIYIHSREPYPCDAEMMENDVEAFVGEISCELDRLIYSGHEKAARHQKRHASRLAEATPAIAVIPEQAVEDCDWHALRELTRKAIADDDTALLRAAARSPHFEPDGAVDARRGWTALLLATYAGRRGQVRLLLEEAGADPNAAGPRGTTPLLVAAREEYREVAVELLRHGADTERRDAAGWTPLLAAARAGSAGALEALLRRGACADAALPDGRTALHVAAAAGRAAVACLLRRHGARPDARDRAGRTPLDVAREAHQHGAERVLLAGLGGVGPSAEEDGGAVGRSGMLRGGFGHRHGYGLRDVFDFEGVEAH